MTILGRSEELFSRCVECDLAEPESLSSLGGSAPGVVDGILSYHVATHTIHGAVHALISCIRGVCGNVSVPLFCQYLVPHCLRQLSW